MANVTIHVEQETAQCLAEKAKQGGQTLESYPQRCKKIDLEQEATE